MEKIWLEHYEPGVAHEVDVQRYKSIHDVFWQTVEKYHDKPGFTNMGKVQTYGQTGALVNQFASYVQNHLKMKKGDRIALMMPNILQYPVVVFAALQAGLIVVNVNPLYTPRELAHQLKDSGAKTIVVMENFADTLAKALEHTDLDNIIIASIGDLLGPIKGRLINFVVRHIKRMVPRRHLMHGAIRFNQTLKIGQKTPFKKMDISLEDLAFLQYTGGTTGVAKGAMLTHGNICANMAQASEWIKSKIKPQQEIVLSPLPLYHIFSLTVNLMIFTEAGSQNILITNPRDIAGFIKEIKKYKVSAMSGVNTLFNAMLHHPDFASIDFSTWKIVLAGGMTVQKAVAEQWKKITGIPLIEAYGLTETSPGACVNPMNIEDYNGTIGVPLPNTDVQIRDDDGHELPVGETGELFIKGPQVMKGYWQQPKETEQVLGSDGFLATGDIAVMNEKGYVKLVDRKKDMIVVSGFNVYPNEVEDVIMTHPDIIEVACIGVPSEQTGEAIKLFVVSKNPNLTTKEIIRFARKSLTAYKVPKQIEFRDELPKSNVGKILRRELRSE